MVPRAASEPSSSAANGEGTPEERPHPSPTLVQMGTNMPRLKLVDLQNLGAPPFIPDDPAEETDWRHYHGIMGGMAHLLNTALGVVNDGLKQLNSAIDPCEVRCARPLVVASCFVVSNLCPFRSR
jgi:hypothetical protein